MKALAIVAALMFCTPAFAQSTTERKADDSKPAAGAPQEGNPAFEAGAGSSADRAKNATFTHGESKRCESLTGADKKLCDEEEGTKAEGRQAEDLSKNPDRPRQ